MGDITDRSSLPDILPVPDLQPQPLGYLVDFINTPATAENPETQLNPRAQHVHWDGVALRLCRASAADGGRARSRHKTIGGNR
jgi:hypothetical protein